MSMIRSVVSGITALASTLLLGTGALADGHFVTRYGVQPVIHHTPQPLIQHGVPGTIEVTTHFDFDRSRLRPEGEDALDAMLLRVAGFDPGYGMGVYGYVRGGEIVGHTDSIGSAGYNERLALRRAGAVERYLDGQGVNTRMLDVTGMGEYMPVASNATAAGRQQNRRTEIQLRVITAPGY